MQLGGAVLSTALDPSGARSRYCASRAPYEWAQREQLARNVGVSAAEIQAIGSEEPVTSLEEVPMTAYKVSKAAINALSHSLAVGNAGAGCGVNTIMPGLLDTPMAVDPWAARLNIAPAEIRAQRDALVPLRHNMGTARDVAYASLFLHSEEAQFITGAVLPVGGGQLARIGG